MKSLKNVLDNASKQEILPISAKTAIKGGDTTSSAAGYSDPWEKRKRPSGYIMTAVYNAAS